MGHGSATHIESQPCTIHLHQKLRSLRRVVPFRRSLQLSGDGVLACRFVHVTRSTLGLQHTDNPRRTFDSSRLRDQRRFVPLSTARALESGGHFRSEPENPQKSFVKEGLSTQLCVRHKLFHCSGSSPSHAGFCAVESKIEVVLNGSN